MKVFKEVFNKKILSDRSFISMVCFTIVLILVVVLGSVFGYVSADDNISNSEDFSLGISGAQEFLTYEGYQNSSLYFSSAPSYFSNFFPADDTGSGQVGNSVLFSLVTDYVSSYIDSSYSNYVITTGNQYSNSSYFLVSCFDDDTYFYYDPNGAGFTCQGSGHYVKGYVFQVSNGNSISLVYNPSAVELTTFDSAYNGIEFRYKNLSNIYGNTYGPNGRLALSNVPIYAYDTVNVSWPSGVTALWNSVYYFWNNRDTYYKDINYGFADGLVGGEVGASETSSNNMYLDSCKFTFNYNKYVKSTTDDDLSYKGNWNKGNVVFDAILNDYQLEHLDQFTLHIQWQVLIAGKGFYLQENSLGGYDYGTAVPFGGNYVMSTESTYTLSSFHSNGDSLSWNADTIYNSIFCDNSLLVNYNHSLTSLLAQASEFAEIDWSSWKIYANAWLSTTTETSDKRIDSYNFLSGTSTNVSDSLNTNNNPFIDGEDSSFFDSDDSTTTSQTTSNSNGNVTQTVTVNVDNSSSSSGSDSIISKIIDKLLGTTDDDAEYSEAGLTDSFLETTNSNGWLEFFNSSLSFVPNAFWSKLSVMFTTVCAILVIAFILRIILDIL